MKNSRTVSFYHLRNMFLIIDIGCILFQNYNFPLYREVKCMMFTIAIFYFPAKIYNQLNVSRDFRTNQQQLRSIGSSLSHKWQRQFRGRMSSMAEREIYTFQQYYLFISFTGIWWDTKWFATLGVSIIVQYANNLFYFYK